MFCMGIRNRAEMEREISTAPQTAFCYIPYPPFFFKPPDSNLGTISKNGNMTGFARAKSLVVANNRSRFSEDGMSRLVAIGVANTVAVAGKSWTSFALPRGNDISAIRIRF